MTILTAGVDGGGTKCRARIYDSNGSELAVAEGGPANIQTGGRTAYENVIATVDRALAKVGLPESALSRPRVGLGLAGATPAACASFDAQNPPFSEYRIISDAHAAALGALGGEDGGIAILGTGAAGCVVRGGEVRLISGWGFRVDDFGSGADIGRRALRAALRAHDGRDEVSAFSDAVLARFDGDVWKAADWASKAIPAEYATLAPLVFEQAEAGDATALSILNRAMEELQRLIGLLKEHGAEKISLCGSVAQALEARLPADIRAKLSPNQGDAMDGAAMALDMGAPS